LGVLLGSPLLICQPLGLQTGFVCLPLLFLEPFLNLSWFVLFPFTTFLLLHLSFLLFRDHTGLRELVTQTLHRPTLL
jgi:hypothetical protein